jgi:hypothetical protein
VRALIECLQRHLILFYGRIIGETLESYGRTMIMIRRKSLRRYCRSLNRLNVTGLRMVPRGSTPNCYWWRQVGKLRSHSVKEESFRSQEKVDLYSF